MIWTTQFYKTCENEQQFKMKWIKQHSIKPNTHYFCIESESTVLGFPDVLEITTTDGKNRASLYEFKIADKKGKIKFQNTQPGFYKRFPDLDVIVVAYNKVTGKLHEFPASNIFDIESAYRMNNRAEVNLVTVERIWEMV